MALTATATKGFEYAGSLDSSEPLIKSFALQPNTAFETGDLCKLIAATTDAGKATYVTGAALIIGVYIGQNYTTTTNPAASEIQGKFDCNPNSIYRVTFHTHMDFTCDNDSTTTSINDDDLADTANAYVGGYLYCYDGYNKGAARIVSAYDATDSLTVTKPLSVDPGEASYQDKFILLDGDESAHDGVHPGSFVVPDSDGNAIDINACSGGATSGALACLNIYGDDLTMLVTPVTHHYQAAS